MANDSGWLTQTEFCRFFGIAPTTLERSVLPLVRDRKATKKSGRRRLYRARVFRDAWLEYQIAKRSRSSSSDSEEPREDWTQRMLQAKTIRAERRLRAEAGELVSVHELEQAIVPGFARLRAGITTLERRFGGEASAIMRAALEEAEERTLSTLRANVAS